MPRRCFELFRRIFPTFSVTHLFFSTLDESLSNGMARKPLELSRRSYSSYKAVSSQQDVARMYQYRQLLCNQSHAADYGRKAFQDPNVHSR